MRSEPWVPLGVILSIVLLVGCVSDNAKTAIVQNCPPLKTYSADYQAAAADELLAMGDRFPHVSAMIVDYGAERAALRACQ